MGVLCNHSKTRIVGFLKLIEEYQMMTMGFQIAKESIGRWGHPIHFLETFGKIGQVVESNLIRHLGDGIRILGQ